VGLQLGARYLNLEISEASYAGEIDRRIAVSGSGGLKQESTWD
jgi:hypothetical protein